MPLLLSAWYQRYVGLRQLVSGSTGQEPKAQPQPSSGWTVMHRIRLVGARGCEGVQLHTEHVMIVTTGERWLS